MIDITNKCGYGELFTVVNVPMFIPPKRMELLNGFDTSPLKPPRMRRQTDSKEDLNKKKMIKKLPKLECT